MGGHLCSTGLFVSRVGSRASQVGFPLLSGIADFWVSRLLHDTPGAIVEGTTGNRSTASSSSGAAGSPAALLLPVGVDTARDPGGCPLHITHVIPPTEHYTGVSDSVYTNAVAKLALERAVSAAHALHLPRAVWAAWANASTRVVVPLHRPSTDLAGGDNSSSSSSSSSFASPVSGWPADTPYRSSGEHGAVPGIQ